MSAAREVEITKEEYPGSFYKNERLFLKDIMPSILDGDIQYLTALINRGFFYRHEQLLPVAQAIIANPTAKDAVEKFKLLLKAGCPTETNVKGKFLLDLVDGGLRGEPKNLFFVSEDKKTALLAMGAEIINYKKDTTEILGGFSNPTLSSLEKEKIAQIRKENSDKSKGLAHKSSQDSFRNIFEKRNDPADLLSNEFPQHVKEIKELLAQGVVVNDAHLYMNKDTILSLFLTMPVAYKEHTGDEKYDQDELAIRSINKFILLDMLAQNGFDLGTIRPMDVSKAKQAGRRKSSSFDILVEESKDFYGINISEYIEVLNSDEYLDACLDGERDKFLSSKFAVFKKISELKQESEKSEINIPSKEVIAAYKKELDSRIKKIKRMTRTLSELDSEALKAAGVLLKIEQTRGQVLADSSSVQPGNKEGGVQENIRRLIAVHNLKKFAETRERVVGRSLSPDPRAGGLSPIPGSPDPETDFRPLSPNFRANTPSPSLTTVAGSVAARATGLRSKVTTKQTRVVETVVGIEAIAAAAKSLDLSVAVVAESIKPANVRADELHMRDSLNSAFCGVGESGSRTSINAQDRRVSSDTEFGIDEAAKAIRVVATGRFSIGGGYFTDPEDLSDSDLENEQESKAGSPPKQDLDDAFIEEIERSRSDSPKSPDGAVGRS